MKKGKLAGLSVSLSRSLVGGGRNGDVGGVVGGGRTSSRCPHLSPDKCNHLCTHSCALSSYGLNNLHQTQLYKWLISHKGLRILHGYYESAFLDLLPTFWYLPNCLIVSQLLSSFFLIFSQLFLLHFPNFSSIFQRLSNLFSIYFHSFPTLF